MGASFNIFGAFVSATGSIGSQLHSRCGVRVGHHQSDQSATSNGPLQSSISSVPSPSFQNSYRGTSTDRSTSGNGDEGKTRRGYGFWCWVCAMTKRFGEVKGNRGGNPHYLDIKRPRGAESVTTPHMHRTGGVRPVRRAGWVLGSKPFSRVLVSSAVQKLSKRSSKQQ